MISVTLFDGDALNGNIRSKLSNQKKVRLISSTRDFSELEKILAKNHTDVLIFGPSISNADMISFSGFISSKYPQVSIILISSSVDTDLLQDALRTGAKDVLPGSATKAQIIKSIETAHRYSLRMRQAAGEVRTETAAAESAVEHDCQVITFFGAKGGVGTTFIATNIGAGLARRAKGTVVLLDLDLQFGDVAVMLQLQPTHTISDVVSSIDRLDSEMMEGFLSTHHSGLKVLVAPVLPNKADTISSEDVCRIIDILKGICNYIIIDTPASLDDRVLAALDGSDQICLVSSLDMPSLKDTKLTLNMMEALQYRGDRIKLVLNRANSKVKLSLKDVEHALSKKVVMGIPSNIMVPLSVNKGIPIVLDRPRAPVARNLFQFIDILENGSHLPAIGSKS